MRQRANVLTCMPSFQRNSTTPIKQLKGGHSTPPPLQVPVWYQPWRAYRPACPTCTRMCVRAYAYVRASAVACFNGTACAPCASDVMDGDGMVSTALWACPSPRAVWPHDTGVLGSQPCAAMEEASERCNGHYAVVSY